MTLDQFADLYVRHSSGLGRLLRHRYGRDVPAEDLVQDTAARLVDSGDYLKYEHEAKERRAPNWLITAVLNTARDYWRTRERRGRREAAAVGADMAQRGLEVVTNYDDGEEGAVAELGGRPEIQSNAIINQWVAEEDAEERWRAARLVLGDLFDVALRHYGDGETWPSEAVRKQVERRMKKLGRRVRIGTSTALLSLEEPN